jgi:hypothetical protein
MSKVLTKSFGIGLTRRSAAVPIRAKQRDNLKNCPTIFHQLIGGTIFQIVPLLSTDVEKNAKRLC